MPEAARVMDVAPRVCVSSGAASTGLIGSDGVGCVLTGMGDASGSMPCLTKSLPRKDLGCGLPPSFSTKRARIRRP